MEEQLEKEYHTPILVEDLGMIFRAEKSTKKEHLGIFRCFCGNEFTARLYHINSGWQKSCGCLRHNNKGKTTHGLSKDRLYTIWKNMLYRCNNPEYKYYHNYGGRGITVCSEWHDNYVTFKEWSLANGYADDLSIDRINVDGNYEPSNCRWSTRDIQSQNTRLIISTNTSGFRGVCWNKAINKWQVYLSIKGKRIHIGCFDTPEEGAIAYNNYVIENNLSHPLNPV